jgi:beta-glucosidase
MMNRIRCIFAILVIIQFAGLPAESAETAGLEEKIRSIFKQLTLEEKVHLLSGFGASEIGGIPRLNIPTVKMTDGPQGVRGPISTYFPTAIAYAASWNPELIEAFGKVLAGETKAAGCGVILGPAVNIMRTPLNGRNFEYMGEDPYLAGMTAVAYIQGVQSQGVSAAIKHFALNNQEKWRTTNSSQADEKAIHEIYLPAFRMACQKAGVWAVMSSYNKINGTYGSANRYLQFDVAKRSWGWDGAIMSDWGAVHDAWSCAMGGLDLEMPGRENTGEELLKLVKENQLPESFIDDKVIRVLRFIFRITDHPLYKTAARANTPESVSMARRIAEESIVLLKNSGILPLNDRLKSIAVIGPAAAYRQAMRGLQSGGSGAVNPPYEITPLQAIRDRFAKKMKIVYAEGISYDDGLEPIPSRFLLSSGRRGLKGEYFADGGLKGSPAAARNDASIDYDFARQAARGGAWARPRSIRWTGTIRAPASGAYKIGVECPGTFTLVIDGKPILESPGIVKPQAMTAQTEWKAGGNYQVRIEYRDIAKESYFRLYWTTPERRVDPWQAALNAAKGADIVLYFGGLNHRYDTEAIGWGDLPGADHPDYELVGRQSRLIEELSAINPNTVVTLIGGTPMNVEPFVDRVKALLMAWYPGQEGGGVIADILWGRVNPSGKLCCTWAKRLNDYACHFNGNYPGTGNYGIVNYDEGIFVGYRWFDRKKIAPRFPFGFGLSYSRFTLDDIRIENPSAPDRVKIVVRGKVKNDGRYPGAQVVQVYTGLPLAGYERPEKELRGFQKIFLNPGEAKDFEIVLDRDAFSAYFVGEPSRWEVVRGKADLFVGTSAEDIQEKKEVMIP